MFAFIWFFLWVPIVSICTKRKWLITEQPAGNQQTVHDSEKAVQGTKRLSQPVLMPRQRGKQ